MPSNRLVPAVAGAILAASAADAHHSDARFDTDQLVEIQGAVTRYEWANPHVYIYVEQKTDAGETIEWEIEGQPPAILRRQGWSPETLAVGDVIAISGNPHRREGKKSLLLKSLERADSTLYDYQGLFATLASPAEAPSARAESLEGVWATLLNPEVMFAFINPEENMTLTEAGAAAAGSFDETTMNPGAACVGITAPVFMLMPDVKAIGVSDDRVTIRGEFDGSERIIHLSQSSHDGISPSIQGYSVGRWEGETLVIETTHFAPHGTGLADSLPSSPEKRLVERLTLADDGASLTYAFELTDSVHLAEPVTGEAQWAYRPDHTFTTEPCDLENARRFIGE